MDRTSLAPRHIGDLVLPCDPLFTRLLVLANRYEQRPAIRDVNLGIERNAAELLSDAITLRQSIRSSLTPKTLHELDQGAEVYVTLLAPGGYEFAVGILAILALGTATSTLSVAQPVEEATYYVNKARSVAIVASGSALSQAQALATRIKATTNPDFVCVPVRYNGNSEQTIDPSRYVVSSSGYANPNKAGIVIFTSGTTAPPKGAVLRHAAIADGALSFAEQLNLKETDTLLHLLPVHHATGIWVSFFPFLLSGACIEFRSGSFDAEWTWNRWKKGNLTYFTGVPTIYMRMMRHYYQVIQKMPKSDVKNFEDAAKKLKVCMCGTSALPKPIDDFWRGMLGRRIVQRYGSSELGVVFNMPFSHNETVPDGSAGLVSLGVDVKLSEGDEGEILARSFNMFSKYLHDPEATRAAHDEQGYFKSGDIAKREGKYYFIVGRASVDIIKSGGYKISALDVEREIIALPYIGEVMVVGVPDEEYGQRVGAVVSLRDDETSREFYQKHSRDPHSLHLDDLRSDVRGRLAGYKLPTLLRVITEELPKSASGKVVKRTLGPQYFTSDYRDDPQVQVWDKEVAMKAKI